MQTWQKQYVPSKRKHSTTQQQMESTGKQATAGPSKHHIQSKCGGFTRHVQRIKPTDGQKCCNEEVHIGGLDVS